jgi:hypothetical protein
MLGFVPLSATALSSISSTEFVYGTANVNAVATVTAAGKIQASANAAILGRAVVTALEGPTTGSASITGRAVVGANGGFLRTASGFINVTATVTAIGENSRFGTASIVGTAIVSAVANNDVLAFASVIGKADVRAAGGVTRASAVGSITGRSIVTAKGMIYGDEWVKVSPVGDTWLRQE